MKNKVLLILNILVILFCATILVLHFTGISKMTTRTFMKAGVLLITYVLGVLNYLTKSKSSLPKTTQDTELYKHILRDAFSHDKAGYRKLMRGIALYNADQYNQAIKELTRLEKRCVSHQDTSAVLFFIAKCHKDKDETGKAIQYYEHLLRTDASNSTAWSNLGLIHHEAGRVAMVERQLQNN